MIHHRDCPYCHSTTLQPFTRKGDITLEVCSTCQLIFMNPMFTSNELSKIYSGYYTSRKQFVGVPFGYAHYEQERSPKIMCKLYLPWISKHVPPGSTVLDVGCATGTLLEIMNAEQYHTVGLETATDAWPILLAKNLEFFSEPIQIAKLDEYDAVIMLDVLEHLTSPFEDLRIIHSKLSPNGKLLIETVDSDAINLPKKWRHYWSAISPVHLYYWGGNQLSQVLTDLGFRVIDLSKQRPRLSFIRWLINIVMGCLRTMGITKIGKQLVTFNPSLNLKKLLLPALYGDLPTMRIVAEKITH